MSKFEYKQPPKHHKSEIEITPENLQVFTESLLGLDKQGVEKLKERIASNRGHVRMMMHPFFTNYNRFSDQAKFRSSYDHTLLALKNATHQSSSSPVFLFEAEGVLENVRKMVSEEVGDVEGSILYIPTQTDSSYVSAIRHIPNMNEYNYSSFVLTNSDEEYVVEMFKMLGVRSATVSGMWLDQCLTKFMTFYRSFLLVDHSKNCLVYDRSMEDSNIAFQRKIRKVLKKQTGKIK